MLKKSPNEMTKEDVQKNAQKRLHNAEVMQDFIEKAEGKTIGILNRKNISSMSVDAKRFPNSAPLTSSLITFKVKPSFQHIVPKTARSIKKY